MKWTITQSRNLYQKWFKQISVDYDDNFNVQNELNSSLAICVYNKLYKNFVHRVVPL